MKYLAALIFLFAGYSLPLFVQAAQPLHTEVVTYRAGDTTLKGYLAYDPAIEEPRPGVLVVHEWWGLNDYARRRARELAQLGYVAFAADMYGGGRATEDPERAGELAGSVEENPALTKARFMAALDVLRGHDVTDASQIAAIGYCFGGTVVLDMARAGVDMGGVVSFHGSLPLGSPPQEGEVRAKVLVLHGGADAFVTDEQLSAFRQQMARADADFRIVIYPGAKHSFTNPAADQYAKLGLDIGYNAQADKESWRDMNAFFERIFDE